VYQLSENYKNAAEETHKRLSMNNIFSRLLSVS